MGVVVAATHLELGHRVAIKFLRDEMAGNPTIVDRFLREARAVVHLRTEHVCRVTDVGRTADGAPYIVMELLEGVDLQRVVTRQPLPSPLATAYVIQACVALAEAHAAGIIHRDLKPANLFVTRRLDGTPLLKVLDFGIAKAVTETGAHLTHTQGALGSPGYMSPEQLQSARDVDARTDIWSLGVTLYQLLSARLPFTGTTPAEIAVKVATDPPAPLDVEPRLAAVVMRCLDKSPDRRYPDVAALAAELAAFAEPAAAALVPTVQTLAHRPGGYTAPAPVAPAQQATQATTAPTPARSRWPIALGVLAIVAVGGIAAAVALSDGGRPAAPRDAAAVALVPPDAAMPVDAAPGLDAAAELEAGSADAPDDDGDDDAVADLLGGSAEIGALTAQAQAMAVAACKKVSRGSDAASALARLVCACTTKDAKAAAEAWPHVTLERAQMRQLCAMQGVKLP